MILPRMGWCSNCGGRVNYISEMTAVFSVVSGTVLAFPGRPESERLHVAWLHPLRAGGRGCSIKGQSRPGTERTGHSTHVPMLVVSHF